MFWIRLISWSNCGSLSPHKSVLISDMNHTCLGNWFCKYQNSNIWHLWHKSQLIPFHVSVVNLGYLEPILVHPTRRQTFASKLPVEVSLHHQLLIRRIPRIHPANLLENFGYLADGYEWEDTCRKKKDSSQIIRQRGQLTDTSNLKDDPTGTYWFCLLLKEEMENEKTKWKQL